MRLLFYISTLGCRYLSICSSIWIHLYLKKNLIESGLGEGLCGVGLEEGLRQMYFSTGLKGIDGKDFKKSVEYSKQDTGRYI